MNKYKFANGYVAQWSDKAINPEQLNTNEIIWSPNQPNLQDCGDQFIGEYLYSFVPRMMQPIVNRTQKKMLYAFDTTMDCVIMVKFQPNQKPIYEEVVFPVSSTYKSN